MKPFSVVASVNFFGIFYLSFVHHHDRHFNFFFFQIINFPFLSRPELLLDRVRRSVRAVVPCNVLLSDPLADYKEAAASSDAIADVPSSYDVIITTLCLEFASLCNVEYSTAVSNVTRLLRPSGYLIMQVNFFRSIFHASSMGTISKPFYSTTLTCVPLLKFNKQFLDCPPFCFRLPLDIRRLRHLLESRELWATVIIGITTISFRLLH